jgi:hypothetical protein
MGAKMLRTGLGFYEVAKNKSPAKLVNKRLCGLTELFYKKIVAMRSGFATFHVPPRKATVSLAETQSSGRKINQKIR